MLTADLTSVTLGSIFAEVSKDGIDKILNWLQQMSVIVESGVASVGPASAYALVWEFGNIQQSKKGPKTVKGTNPDGKRVWLSIQAPKGWIAINESKIWAAIEEEIAKIEFDSINDVTEDNVKQQLQQAYERISQRALELLQSTVPIDRGDLYDSLEVVPVNDSSLSEIENLSGSMVDEITGTLNL